MSYPAAELNYWTAGIMNFPTGTLNITAKKADVCTSTPTNTTSGLCSFASCVDNPNINIGLANQGTAYVNGGTYYGGGQGLNNEVNGIMNIKNADIKSNAFGIWAGSETYTNTTTRICNCKFNAVYDDITFADGKVYYDSNTIFSNNTNTPVNHIYNNGTITQVTTCPF